MKRAIVSVGLCLATLVPAVARADVGPPAHLRISEREPGRFVAQWRVPKVLPANAVPVPELPETCSAVGGTSVDEQANAWLFTQEFRCDGGLAGETVGMSFPFADLAVTTVARVDLLSGDRFANLLAPGDAPWRLPAGTAAPERLRDTARAVEIGARHVFRSWPHLGLVLAMGLLGTLRRSIRVVTAFTIGQIAGILGGIFSAGIGTIPAEMAVGILAALLAREALRSSGEGRRFLALPAVGGTVHGLALGSLLADRVGEAAAGILPRFLAAVGMDAAHLVAVAAVSALVARTARKRSARSVRTVLAYACGAAGIALALGLAADGGAVGPSATESNIPSAAPQVPASSASAAGSRRIAPSVPDVPVQSYLVIEPFEVRHEAMLRLGRLTRTLGLDPGGTLEVPVQAMLLERLIAFVLDGTSVEVDGQVARGDPLRVDFMTVDSTGALPRSVPAPEQVGEAVVGVVVVYPTDGMPRRVSVEWNAFPTEAGAVPIAVIDPESTRSQTLTAADSVLTWDNDLAEDPIPTVAAVVVEPRKLPLPLLSLPLFAGAVLVLVLGWKRRRAEESIAGARVLLALALVVAPVVQPALNLPASASGVPSARQARRILAGLLPNVYRAMEFRDEGLIFDRLAVSVTGDTLTEVYLEQRRTLEMEERGGAQARVEAVEILDAREIEPRDAGFRVRATWTAAGMVTHFGHRHFRRNRYQARLTVVPVEGTWKIRAVEILEQDRLQ